MNKNNLFLLKNNIFGSIVFSVLSIFSIIIMLCGWFKLFTVHVSDSDFIYEFLFSRDYLIWDKNVEKWYTHYYSDVVAIAFSIFFIIFFFFSLLFKGVSYKYSLLFTLDDKYKENKFKLIILVKWNFIFGLICGILILSTLNTLINNQGKKKE